MSDAARMTVILCWHMHQPEYRDAASGTFRFPWTLLHALKDYVDMAAHLEAEPRVRAVVNFAPVLLEQIADYVARFERNLAHGAQFGEPLLDALAFGPPVGARARALLIRQCLRANRRRVIARFPAWERLLRMLEPLGEDDAALDYLSDRFITDLLLWYWIGWIAETERRGNALIADLVARGGGFTAADRRAVLQLLRESLGTLLARYRALADRGQVELAMSPYAHPILPLLLDLQSAREALPDAPLPQAEGYPGGEERARWQLRHGREIFRTHLGRAPAGCWPSEGALSTATLRLLADEGFRWCASGESVLRNSRAAAHVEGDEHACRHRVYRIEEAAIDCFFRDDGLSDLVGFSYADWHAEDAVANLVHHMENIAAACPDRRNCALSVILDGENAWEYYPENAFHFLSGLYRALADHPHLVTGTFSSFLDGHRPEPARLPRLVAGSWVYGTLSTWIGSTDKNRGWELLVEAKQACDRVLATQRLDAAQRAAVERQLAVCEGSDWFWWFGDYNPAQAVSDFEQLFRHHIESLYRLLGEAPPPHLGKSFTHGGGDAPHGGTMRASTEVR